LHRSELVLAVFLNPSMTVTPTVARDYPEWHRGREWYGLWYIEITQPELLLYLAQLRQQFTDVLFNPNTRQFHISLFICGFLTDTMPVWDDDFVEARLIQHVRTLKQQYPLQFHLKTGRLNSFETALFIEVHDASGTLQHLRYLLGQHTVEIAPVDYCPHITLGLYNQAWSADQIIQRFEKIEQQTFEFSVEQLTFGYYQAQKLQGHLYPHTQFLLGEKCCN